MDFNCIEKNLLDKGYLVRTFKTAAEATGYLASVIKDQIVGFGGSITLEQMGLYEKLSAHNTVYWHQLADDANVKQEMITAAATSTIYISSVNGLSTNGEIVNIDGNCNRISSIFYGHKKVFLVVGKNKIANDLEDAIYRARNIAAPLNAKRLKKKTPCALNADKCYNCKSSDRICRGLSVMLYKPSMCDYEIILINEDLGF